MKRRLFTLIELIVVIVVIGILAAIVIPNVSTMKEQATETAVASNQKNLQTAVDMFMLENNGLTPTKGVPELGEPKTLEIYGLHPEQIRSLPKTEGVYWWLDYNNTVWGSYVDTPKNVVLSTDGTLLSWDTTDGATAYNIYKAKSASVEGTSKGKGLQFFKTYTQSESKAPKVSVEKSDDEIYLVSAIDRHGFETVAVKVKYQNQEYIEPDKEFDIGDSNNSPTPVKSKRLLDEVPIGWIGIYNATDLAAMTKDKKYILMEDIDLNISPYNEGAGWMPKSVSKFNLNGNGLSIKNLYINRPNINNVGLFGHLSSGSKITNLNLVDINITGNLYTGGLIGQMSSGVIVENVSVTGSVVGNSEVGGIAGLMQATGTFNRISQSYVNVKVKAERYAGAIFGVAHYSTSNNQIRDVYAFGEVNATRDSGGLFGSIVGPFTVINAYSVVHVKGNISSSHTKYLYAFTGSNYSLGETVYWDYIASDTPNDGSNGRQKRTTEQMQKQSNYVNWDFENIWKINEGTGYPEFKWQH